MRSQELGDCVLLGFSLPITRSRKVAHHLPGAQHRPLMKYQYSDSHSEDNRPLPPITYSLIMLPLLTFKDEKIKVIKIFNA